MKANKAITYGTSDPSEIDHETGSTILLSKKKTTKSKGLYWFLGFVALAVVAAIAVGIYFAISNSKSSGCSAGNFLLNVTHEDGTTSLECTQCPGGSFSNETDSLSCFLCSPGSFAGAGAAVCSFCDAGSFASDYNSSSCTSCPPNTISNQTGATSCDACPVGSYSGSGFTSCLNSTDACNDYYYYVCSPWQAENPRPSDTASWNKLSMIQRKNNDIVEQIIKGGQSSAQVSTYWQACMNITYIESLGLTPLYPWLSLIPAATTITDWVSYFELAGRLKNAVGIDLLLEFTLFDSNLGFLTYIKQTPSALVFNYFQYSNESYHSIFVTYASNIFTELGDSPDDALANAELVWQLEKTLAANWDTVRPPNAYTAYYDTLTAFVQANNLPPLGAFFNSSGANVPTAKTRSPIVYQSIKLAAALPTIVTTPSNFTALYQHIRLHFFLHAAQFLATPQQSLHHFLINTQRFGIEDLSARENFCDGLIDTLLGDAIAVGFYDETFSPNKQTLIEQMTGGIHQSFQALATNFTWANATAIAALKDKDSKMVDILGLPPSLRNYSSVTLSPTTFFNDTMILYQVNWQITWNQMDNPMNHSWAYSPVIVNAFYYPGRNSLNMPVGILQPSPNPTTPGFFDDTTMARGEVWGAIGTVIGHELSHGFDSNGIRFNAQGVQDPNWIPAATLTNYTAKTSCFVTEYNSFTFAGLQLNGARTLGENIADMGGIQLSYLAYQNWLQTVGGTEPIPTMTPQPVTTDQLFLQSWAHNWCSNQTDAYVRSAILSGVHSIPWARVNGPLRNFKPFAQAYNCPASTFMNPPPAEQCSIY